MGRVDVTAAQDELLNQIYDVAIEPARLTALSETIARLAGVPAAGVRVEYKESATMRQAWHGLPAAFEARYVDGLWRDDPWVAATPQLTPGAFVLGHADLERIRPGTGKTAFVNELCVPFGFRDVMGSVLVNTASVLVTFGMLCEELATDRLSAAAMLGAFVAPHLARVMRLVVDKEQAAARAAAFSGAAAAPVLWIGRRGRLLFANEAAELILSRGDGLQLVGGVLTAVDPREAATLRRAIGRPATGSLVRVSRAERPPLALTLAPAAPESGASFRVIVTDLDGLAATPQRALRVLFDLTSAEARLAELIAQGHPLKEAADHLGVQLSTVRTQLLRIYDKTQTRRQADLVRLLLKLGATEIA